MATILYGFCSSQLATERLAKDTSKEVINRLLTDYKPNSGHFVATNRPLAGKWQATLSHTATTRPLYGHYEAIIQPLH